MYVGREYLGNNICRFEGDELFVTVKEVGFDFACYLDEMLYVLY